MPASQKAARAIIFDLHRSNQVYGFSQDGSGIFWISGRFQRLDFDGRFNYWILDLKKLTDIGS